MSCAATPVQSCCWRFLLGLLLNESNEVDILAAKEALVLFKDSFWGSLLVESDSSNAIKLFMFEVYVHFWS